MFQKDESALFRIFFFPFPPLKRCGFTLQAQEEVQNSEAYNVNHIFKANQPVFAVKTLMLKAVFERWTYACFPRVCQEISSRDSLAYHSQPWFLSPLYRNFPSVLAVCSALGGGIFEMGESVSVAGMCSYSFVYFMYESSPTVACATHQVSDIVIHPRERLV